MRDELRHPAALDPAAIARFAEVVFGYCEGFVPVRVLPEKGMPPATPIVRFPSTGESLAAALAGAAEEAARLGRALFVLPGAVGAPGRARSEDVTQTAVVLVDLDGGDVAAKRAHVERHLGPATLVVASGGRTSDAQQKLHLHWRLTEAARGDDLATVCRLRRLIAEKVGGDRSFRSLSQPIRVAGSVHNKHGKPAPVLILAESPAECDLGELAEAVEAMPVLESVLPEQVEARIAASDLMTRRVREGGVDGVTRHDALSKVIGHWLRQARLTRVTIEQAWKRVVEHNSACIVPPWPEEALRREFDALLALDARNHSPQADEDGGAPGAGGEDALALAFTAKHAKNWSHVLSWGLWLEWTGARWRSDATGRAVELARLICRAAADAAKPGEARRIASDKTIRAVERLARTDLRHAARAEDWDTDPMLLNTPAGIVDLATGEIRPHQRQAMMTKMTKASPGSGCPLWHAFIATITNGDAALSAYLARVAGYCMTGLTHEHAFFFLHGQGSNGKSVFVSALADALGDYATAAPPDAFMSSRSDRHPTELAGLMGARLVSATETERGRAWAESRIKTITGGDPMRARFMRQDFVEFRPSFKLVVVGNHLPRLASVSEAMRRRLHVIPFAVTIPDERRDKRLGERLQAERDGILGWMLTGCAEWGRIGLAPPPAIRAASDEYFAEEDMVGQWITDACRTGPEERATIASLFSSWSGWARAAGVEPGSQRDLSEALKARRFRPWRSSRARGWVGLSLRHRVVDPEHGEGR